MNMASESCTGSISYQLVGTGEEAKEETCDLFNTHHYYYLIYEFNYPRDGCGASCTILSVLAMMTYKVC